MTYAIVDDVVKELGRPAISDAESEQWEAWLGRVERSIRRRFTRAGYDLDTQIGLNKPSADDIIDVEVARVIDKIENPIVGQTSYTVSVDDASKTYRREGANSIADALTITDEEWAAILPATGRRSGIFSVMPS